MDAEKWGLTPETVSAVATAGATIVALGVGTVAIWQHKRKARKAKKLAKALFAHEAVELTIATAQLSTYESRKLLATGHLPTGRQRKALKLVFIKEHLLTLDLDAAIAEKLALLLNQTEMLSWLVEDVIAGTNLQLREAATLSVAVQADATNKTAIQLLEVLHRPGRWKRWLFRAKKLATARKRPVQNAAPEADPLAETIPQ